MPFCCFTTGFFLNGNVLKHLFYSVDSVLFTIQKPLGLRSVLLKEGKVETGVIPLQLWKQDIFVANNERLYFSGPSAALYWQTHTRRLKGLYEMSDMISRV